MPGRPALSRAKECIPALRKRGSSGPPCLTYKSDTVCGNSASETVAGSSDTVASAASDDPRSPVERGEDAGVCIENLSVDISSDIDSPVVIPSVQASYVDTYYYTDIDKSGEGRLRVNFLYGYDTGICLGRLLCRSSRLRGSTGRSLPGPHSRGKGRSA